MMSTVIMRVGDVADVGGDEDEKKVYKWKRRHFFPIRKELLSVKENVAEAVFPKLIFS